MSYIQYITSVSRNVDTKALTPQKGLSPVNWPFPVVNGIPLRKPVNPFEHEALL